MQDQPGTGEAADPEVVFVDDRRRVRDALVAVDAPVVGVDVERADADRYFRAAALVQVGVHGHCVLLDGVALETLPELDAFLGADRLTVLHAVENDLDPLATKGVRPTRLADTAVAAAVLGLPTGLGPLLETVLGVALDGRKGAFQRADWTLRPLPDDMAAYAAGDVVHLPALWEALAARLDTTGRHAWYEEELAWTLERAAADTRDWERVKGAGRLDPRQRSVLRAVWEERERIARQHDIAPNRLLRDEVLRELATSPPGTASELVRRSQRRRGLVRQHAHAFLDAIERGLAAAPETRSRSRRWSDDDRAAFDAMRRARTEVAEEVGIDPGVLCPSRQLWAAVAGAPTDATELARLAGLRRWQADLLADALWEASLGATRTVEDPDAAPAREP